MPDLHDEHRVLTETHMALHLEALTPAKLGVFRDLLGSSEFGGCFCAVWTHHDENWVSRCQDKAQPNFFLTQRDLQAGRHVGYLVYQGEDLVGWTGSGPKTSFPFLKTKLGSRISNFSGDVWSIGCLAVREKYRGNGISEAIVARIIEEAKKCEAVAVEAYPVRPFREPRVFRGTHSLYVRLGFSEAGFEKDGDHEVVLMSLSLDSRV